MVLICLSSAYSIKNDPNKEVKEGLARVEQQTNGDFWFDGIKYQLNSAEKTAMVIYQGGTTSGNIVIPETLVYNGVTFRVTSIDDGAFRNCHKITSVTIPNSVTSIGVRAFYGCSSLKSVVIPSSIKSIKYETFRGCSSLTSIRIPDNVTSIESSAFMYCSSLTSVIIPDGVTNVGRQAFERCTSLTSVVLPQNITSIKEMTFYDCALKSITIPNSVTSIEDGAFTFCKLSSVVIPNNVTSIGAVAFSGCPLTSVKIPDSVKKLGTKCFADNRYLRSASVPSTIEDFGNEGIFEETYLKEVTVRYPKGVTKQSTDRIWFYFKGAKTKEEKLQEYQAESRAADPNSMSWPSPKITKDWHWEHGDYERTVYWHGLGGVTFIRYGDSDYYYGVSPTSGSYVPSARFYKTYNDAEAYAYFYLKYGRTRDRGYVYKGKTSW